MTEYEHNKCDICGKQLSSALAFHHHYGWCLSKKYPSGSTL